MRKQRSIRDNAQRRCYLLVSFALGLGLVWLVIGWTMTRTPVAQAQGTTITVNTADDELNDGGGDCSLREAIQAANTDSAVDGCPAGSGHDTIILPAGTYTLTVAGANDDTNATGDLDLLAMGGDLTVVGNGPGSTFIDGNGAVLADCVFDIPSSSTSMTVTLSGITLRHGFGAGGGVRNDGAHTVVITNCTVYSNTSGSYGGGISVNGTTHIVNSIGYKLRSAGICQIQELGR